MTGGAGFIGQHLSKRLVRLGNEVRILDSLDPQVHGDPSAVRRATKTEPGREMIVGDVRSPADVKRAIEGVDVIFHEAAAVGVGQSMYQIRRYVDVNCMGTANILDILVNEEHDVKKLVVASSNTVYGEGRYTCPRCGRVSPGMRPLEQLEKRDWELYCPRCGSRVEPAPTDEEKPLSPTSVYAATKMEQEQLALQVGKAYGLPVVVLRYFNVLGPGQSLKNPYTGICAIFSSRIRSGRPPIIYEDGLQTRDLVSVHDVVQANVLAMETRAMDMEVFNVGTGRPTTILYVAEKLIQLHRSPLRPEVSGRFRKGDIRHCYADISKIARHGYSPSYTSEKAIEEFYAWSLGQEAEDLFEEAEREMDERGLVV